MRNLLCRALTLLALAVFLSPLPVFAAGSCSVSFADVTNDIGCVTYSWTGDSVNGGVPATGSGTAISAYVVLVQTNPGSTAPTDDYDITITDDQGEDILGGEGADRDTANTESAVPKIDAVYGERVVNSILTLNITNQSVASATGTVKVYFRK